MTLELPDLGSVPRNSVGWQSSAVVRFRDLLLIRQGEMVTAIACDSNAGIGNRPADVLSQPARHTGLAATKVPMMEVMAAGATPLIVINALGSSRDGDGAEIVAGIEECIRRSGHTPMLTGSDETNIATVQSSVGVTVIGIVDHDRLMLGRSRIGDVVLLVGRPMDGITIPYAETDSTVVSVEDVGRLAADDLVHEILPVGSKGVRQEAGELARTAGLRFCEAEHDVDMLVSAGSSTCLIASCAPSAVDHVESIAGHPCVVVGHLLGSD